MTTYRPTVSCNRRRVLVRGGCADVLDTMDVSKVPLEFGAAADISVQVPVPHDIPGRSYSFAYDPRIHN